MKNSFPTVLLFLVTYIFVELVSYLGLELVGRRVGIKYEPIDLLTPRHEHIQKRFLAGESSYYSLSSDLGWTILPDGHKDQYQSNSAGIRSSREYEPTPAPGIIRIATFGDSFTHGDDVGNEETWQAYIERSERNIEALNFGVSAYGLDQAYLRYIRDGKQYDADIVLIGFMPENIFRNVNTYRPFYFTESTFPLAKPRFTLYRNELTLIPGKMDRPEHFQQLFDYPQATLRDLGADDFYFRLGYKSGVLDWSPSVRLVKIIFGEIAKRYFATPIVIADVYNENSDAFKLTTTLFDEFYREVQEAGSRPIILILPQKLDIVRHNDRLESRYAPLLRHFESRGYEYIDMLDKLGSNEIQKLFHGHYRPGTNKAVAEAILEYISLQY